jgi:hypothetical protein
LVVGGLIVGSLAAFGWFTQADRNGTAASLRSLPEAELTYPGSELISSGGGNAKQTIDGRQSAFTWRFLGVNASPDAIQEFYERELAAGGWQVDVHTTSGLRPVEEVKTTAWSKGGVIFRLGIRDPNYWGADPGLFARYQSLYDARLIGDRRQ